MKPSARMARLTGTALLISTALVACAAPMSPLGVLDSGRESGADNAEIQSQPRADNASASTGASGAGRQVDRDALREILRAAFQRAQINWTVTSAPSFLGESQAPSPVAAGPSVPEVTPSSDAAVAPTPQSPVQPSVIEEPATTTPETVAPVPEAVVPPAPVTEETMPPAAEPTAVAPAAAPVEAPDTPSPVGEGVETVPSEAEPLVDSGVGGDVVVSDPDSPPAETPAVAPTDDGDSTAVQPSDTSQPVPAEADVPQPEVEADGQAQTEVTQPDAAPVAPGSDGASIPVEPATDGTPVPVDPAQPDVDPTQPDMEPAQPEASVPDGEPTPQPAEQPAEPVVEPVAEQSANQSSEQTAAEPAAQPGVQPAEEIQPVVDTQSETQPDTQPESQPAAQPGTQPAVQPESQPVSEPGTQPASETETTPEIATEAEPVSTEQPAAEPQPSTDAPITTVTAPTAPATADAGDTGGNTDAGRVAYLHGYQQSQGMCPGGSMVGLVDTAIVAPLVAAGVLADGDCTLADMKAANPDTQFLAYLNIGGMSAVSRWDQAPFYPGCVDPAYGGEYAVQPNNGAVATNGDGNAVYPAFDHITIADQSASYAQACGDRAVALVTTDSAVGTTGAGPVRFDGVFLDDMAMSPAHGQNMEDIGTWGPWGSDDEYGRAVLRTVEAISNAMDTAGSDKVLAGNLGIYSDKQNQVGLAQELADSGNLDWMMREFVIGSPSGNQFGAFYAVEQNAAVLGQLSRSTPVVMNQFAVDATTDPNLTGAMGGQCLLDSTPEAGSLMWEVNERRQQDMALSLATILTAKESGTNLDMSLMQAEPDCQETAASGPAPYENVTSVSVDESDPEIAALRAALNDPSVVAVGEKSNWYEYTVWRRDLSDGRQVWVNYRQEAVVIEGVTIPAQSGVITG